VRLTVTTWEELQQRCETRLYLVYEVPGFGDWLSHVLTGADDLGPALGGELYRVPRM